ncbi:hypothetical protein A3C09_03585 [Candidatus Uhrbacteria bacterium RIFCSPHIGHO2_02_FULL_47_44]|uniref:Uncharacterized protein n=1 Tax=Candidatus Uhrbacteria bacterium RIFCSPLOWO2_02_FULL_48_18 TaxID=1802408 RepID=A0A1F7V701_9BACT|nr:MAG: hypothetical protein A2839_04740 [Candidatus Uhrbacteria bacterium RIFCSPHIGHO2_01_FULL_47_10]OGL71288.1 MAG: hypothetical protein A3C09_03585 [Candidatus Uhrbacteria bacterium RIFCSPHIGHO2_02_FULL_47_44]OGL76102.1 MAG: hypothetical protein A3E97_02415 [Candidatus Uhrbacteria bacterium RIFCSPHIGHO2_12_FULL_47_12]OGL80382.1 MAG: hypothetical protein A3B20_03125 [Candidatus Uhrbacteria bacterium RIFCSPLOWO2_01_FULL_47_17]OGL86241.1 MAG: hypothetical protein A3I41_01615 [Candidatus Uhrbact
MGWIIFIVVAFMVSTVIANLVSENIKSQAADLTWKGIPRRTTEHQAVIAFVWTSIVAFSILMGVGYMFTHIESVGESTTYLSYDEQVNDGHVIYTGN